MKWLFIDLCLKGLKILLVIPLRASSRSLSCFLVNKLYKMSQEMYWIRHYSREMYTRKIKVIFLMAEEVTGHIATKKKLYFWKLRRGSSIRIQINYVTVHWLELAPLYTIPVFHTFLITHKYIFIICIT